MAEWLNGYYGYMDLRYTLYSVHNVNIRGGTYVTGSEEAPDQSVGIC